MTHPAEGHAVGGPVVLCLSPRNYMRCRDRRASVQRAHADAAQGAAMEVSGNDGPPETLVADGGTVQPGEACRVIFYFSC